MSELHPKDHEIQKAFKEKGVDLPLEQAKAMREQFVKQYRKDNPECTESDGEIADKMAFELVAPPPEFCRLLDETLDMLRQHAFVHIIRRAKREWGDQWRTKVLQIAAQQKLPADKIQQLNELLDSVPESALQEDPMGEIFRQKKVGIA